MTLTPNLANYRDDAKRLRFKVEGGLHYIKGNSAPYFSITVDGRDHGSEFGGCCHEIILEHFPQFADLVALHLSDIDGAPSHGLANGFYWLEGGTLFAGRFLRAELHYKQPATWEERRGVVARHFRISESDVDSILRPMLGDGWSPDGGFMGSGYRAKAREAVAAWVETQRPRWKAEADACIQKHGLVVFGDQWERAA